MTTTTAAPSPDEARSEHEDDWENDDYDGFPGGLSRATWSGGWSVGGKVPRLDGSLDRFIDPPERAAYPKSKHYDPAVTIGEDTNIRFERTPKFSFGGGKSRCQDMEPKALAMKKSASQKKLTRSASDTTAEKELARLKAKNRGPARGFGTEERLRYRGGFAELPISPGPAAYEVQRQMDEAPLWAASTTVPWGKRSGGRKSLVQPNLSDIGPGEYTAHHDFTTFSRPHPIFGHPIREFRKAETPAPGKYEVKTSLGDGPGFSVGKGMRPELCKLDPNKPGPGAYDPDMRAVVPESYCTVFGTSERVHPAEGVDPDEPPGPGAHAVSFKLTEESILSAGLSRTDRPFVKKDKISGIPGPGHYPGATASTFGKKATSLHFPIQRPFDNNPAPTDYDPVYSLVREDGPVCSSPRFKQPRKPPWEGPGWGKDANLPTAKPLEKVYVPPGPKWSMNPRRKAQFGGTGPPKDSENHHGMVGCFSSFGTQPKSVKQLMRKTAPAFMPGAPIATAEVSATE